MNHSDSQTFIMYSAREAIEGGFSHIERQVSALENAVIDNPGLAFDLAKTLVESVCRTILRESSIDYKETDDLPRLFRLVSQTIPFLPPTESQESEVRQSMAKTLSGLSTTIQGLCELRNECGFASHGADAPRPKMESAQALLAASAADAIIGFLYSISRQEQTIKQKQLNFEDHNDFNDWVDSAYKMIEIFDLEFRPSEVLFTMDPEGYRNYLEEYKNSAQAITGYENDGETNA